MKVPGLCRFERERDMAGKAALWYEQVCGENNGACEDR
jgi:hypothetical protein